MMSIPEWSFLICILTLIYVYGGFSALIILIGRLLNRTVQKADIEPRVSLIIAAFNEEAGIAEKLESALALEYPADKLEILVASDGSDDRTAEIVRGYKDKGVKLFEFPRRGKIFALNDAVARANGEILLFSDANTLFEKTALRKLVRNFADPAVGGVCGNQLHTQQGDADNSGRGEALYWRYDKWLKNMQSRTGSIVSADGAIYAIRRALYEMPAYTDVTDDFAISTGVIEKKYRLVFEEEAIAYEQLSAKASQEFSRKVRIMNRGLRGVLMRRRLLNPFKYGVYSIVLFSHKLVRRLVPFFLIWMFGASVSLAGNSEFFILVFTLQVAFYVMAGLGYFLRNVPAGHAKILYIPFFYCLANTAALIAVFRLLCGKRIELWHPQRETIKREMANSNVLTP